MGVWMCVRGGEGVVSLLKCFFFAGEVFSFSADCRPNV